VGRLSSESGGVEDSFPLKSFRGVENVVPVNVDGRVFGRQDQVWQEVATHNVCPIEMNPWRPACSSFLPQIKRSAVKVRSISNRISANEAHGSLLRRIGVTWDFNSILLKGSMTSSQDSADLE